MGMGTFAMLIMDLISFLVTPITLWDLQLDNATRDNKNRFVFAFCLLLTYHGVFQEVYINFLIVGHTHDDIDALFGTWSYKLRGTDYPMLPLLMKSFMDTESQPVIPHLIEEVPDFKKFVEGYLCTGHDALAGHTNAQQFKFYRNKVIFIKMRQNHNFETWRIEGECFQESLIIPLNSTSSHSHLRQR